jgi:hypothetical protein
MIRKKAAYPAAATIKPTDFRPVLKSSIEIAARAKAANKTAKILNGFLMGKLHSVAKSGSPLSFKH